MSWPVAGGIMIALLPGEYRGTAVTVPHGKALYKA